MRNQGVLLRGVNTSPSDLLELCFMLLDHAKIMPYYFYMCDMIPNAEHWRTVGRRGAGPAVRVARLHARVRDAARDLRRAVRRQALGAHAQELRPRAGHLLLDARTTAPASSSTIPEALAREYVYFDPIYTLPEEGQQWWRDQVATGLPDARWVEPPAPIEPPAPSAEPAEGAPAPV